MKQGNAKPVYVLKWKDRHFAPEDVNSRKFHQNGYIQFQSILCPDLYVHMPSGAPFTNMD